MQIAPGINGTSEQRTLGRVTNFNSSQGTAGQTRTKRMGSVYEGTEEAWGVVVEEALEENNLGSGSPFMPTPKLS